MQPARGQRLAMAVRNARVARVARARRLRLPASAGRVARARDARVAGRVGGREVQRDALRLRRQRVVVLDLVALVARHRARRHLLDVLQLVIACPPHAPATRRRTLLRAR
eukprot:5569354-Prymnesium_polylepis.1